MECITSDIAIGKEYDSFLTALHNMPMEFSSLVGSKHSFNKLFKNNPLVVYEESNDPIADKYMLYSMIKSGIDQCNKYINFSKRRRHGSNSKSSKSK